MTSVCVHLSLFDHVPSSLALEPGSVASLSTNSPPILEPPSQLSPAPLSPKPHPLPTFSLVSHVPILSKTVLTSLLRAALDRVVLSPCSPTQLQKVFVVLSSLPLTAVAQAVFALLSARSTMRRFHRLLLTRI